MSITIRMDALAQIVTSQGSEKQSLSFPISDKSITAFKFQDFSLPINGTVSLHSPTSTKPRLVFVKPVGTDVLVGVNLTQIATAPKIPDGFPYLAWHTGTTKVYIKNASGTTVGEILAGLWVASTTTTD